MTNPALSLLCLTVQVSALAICPWPGPHWSMICYVAFVVTCGYTLGFADGALSIIAKWKEVDSRKSESTQ